MSCEMISRLFYSRQSLTNSAKCWILESPLSLQRKETQVCHVCWFTRSVSYGYLAFLYLNDSQCNEQIGMSNFIYQHLFELILRMLVIIVYVLNSYTYLLDAYLNFLTWIQDQEKPQLVQIMHIITRRKAGSLPQYVQIHSEQVLLIN